MNKKTLFLILLAVILVVPSITSALWFPTSNTNQTTIDLKTLVVDIENATALIFGCLVVVCFIIAGVMFLTAAGEPEKLKTAKAAFIWGVAGVIVGIIAFSIVAIVGSFIPEASNNANNAANNTNTSVTCTANAQKHRYAA